MKGLHGLLGLLGLTYTVCEHKHWKASEGLRAQASTPPISPPQPPSSHGGARVRRWLQVCDGCHSGRPVGNGVRQEVSAGRGVAGVTGGSWEGGG